MLATTAVYVRVDLAQLREERLLQRRVLRLVHVLHVPVVEVEWGRVPRDESMDA